MSVCDIDELDPHEQNDCESVLGGIPAYAVLKNGFEEHLTDFSNATQWEAAITAGKAVIVKGIKGELPEPSEVTDESTTGCGVSENKTIGHDYTFTVQDFNVDTPQRKNNDNFINQLNKGRFAGIALFLCDSNAVRVHVGPVTFGARIIIPPSDRVQQRYVQEARWFSSINTGLPEIFEAPEDIF